MLLLGVVEVVGLGCQWQVKVGWERKGIEDAKVSKNSLKHGFRSATAFINRIPSIPTGLATIAPLSK